MARIIQKTQPNLTLLNGKQIIAVHQTKATMSHTLQPHQQRVVNEKAELDDRLSKLQAFVENPKFISIDTGEQRRLLEQRNIMLAFSDILGDRIAAFAPTDALTKAVADCNKLRSALAVLIGASTKADLIQMQASITMMPAPEDEKEIARQGVQALLDTLPDAEVAGV